MAIVTLRETDRSLKEKWVLCSKIITKGIVTTKLYYLKERKEGEDFINCPATKGKRRIRKVGTIYAKLAIRAIERASYWKWQKKLIGTKKKERPRKERKNCV